MEESKRPLADETPEEAILVSLDTGEFDVEISLDELEELARTAGARVTGRLIQKREAPDKATCIGSGRLEELREVCENTGVDLVIFDLELSATQHRNLTDALPCRVVDRTTLILDIFAARARSAEGRLQVELAQLEYLLPRLAGQGTALSRLGGGIGTRGPGETKLETDRRHIRSRIARLEEELRQVRQVRAVQRERRIKNAVPVVALVGYTNAGKSTLLNRLTGADIPANNRLFDTLDTTSRQLTVSDTMQVILSDTVGFIAKLPHHLIEAFRATLEELEYADLLLHVIDSSDPDRQAHMEVVERLTAELARPGTPVLQCFNKSDLVRPEDIPVGRNQAAISAATGQGLPELLTLIQENLEQKLRHLHLLLPYSMGGQLEALHQRAKVLSVEYETEGILVEAVCDSVLSGQLQEYVIKES